MEALARLLPAPVLFQPVRKLIISLGGG